MVATKVYALVLISMLVGVFSINFASSLPITGRVVDSAWTHRGGTLSADVQGWAYNPSIAAAAGGTVYAAWAQHRNPSAWFFSGIYVKRWTGSSWEQLGARIGHTSRDAQYPEAYDPSIVVLGTTPYLAWYEGGGYGWGNVGVSVFVAHWDGASWVYDNDTSMPNGALNTNRSADARNPVLAVVNSKLYAAWIEQGDYVAVKHLTANGWVQDGSRIPTNGSKVIDVAIADAGGVPHVVFSGFQRSGSSNLPSTVRTYRLSAGAWIQLGGEIKAQTNDYTNYLAMAAIGTTPYVAMQEKSPSGNYQIYVKHWDGSRWVQDGSSLNVDATAEAGRPALASDGTRLWLAWTEGLENEKSKLYVRSLSGSTWGAAEGPLNVDTPNGPADSPAMAVSGVPYVIWAEKDMDSYTKQVYVKGRDSTGSFVPTTISRWGSNGPTVTIQPNTWVNMQAGGIALGRGVGDEGFSTFVYSPGIKKALVFGKYHAGELSWGEDQNALMGYDFRENRWDLLEITEDAWSENLPGIGHDEGNVAVDTLHDLYITHGDLTLNSGTSWETYVYDLRAMRGKRMIPPVETKLSEEVASAYSPDHDLMLTIGLSSTSWLYDHNTNLWSAIPNSPSRNYPGLVYDSRNNVFVLFGGTSGNVGSNETWIFDPLTRLWTKKSPAVFPAERSAPQMAFDSTNGITLMLGGKTSQGRASEAWVYDAAANIWTQLPDAPFSFSSTGAYLTYNPDDNVFLLGNSVDHKKIWAFRYVPSGVSLPVISFTATPLTVSYGGSSTLSWSAGNAASCTASVAWSGTKPLSGSENTGALTSSRMYTLTCTGTGGTSSKSVTVTVAPAPDTTLPVVSITSPSAGQTVSGTITIQATATDNIAIAGVQFKVDSVNIGAEDATAPYSITWGAATASNGAHTLTAVARDAAGNTATSLAVSVTVNNLDTTPPTISNVAATSITNNSATITWTTNEMSTHQVEHGLSIAYGSQTLENTNLMTSHSQLLTGLAPDTLYHYRVKSKDASGNLAVSGDFIFRTSGAATPGDINGDRSVGILDILVIVIDFSKTSGFNPRADANSDGVINLFDIMVVVGNWGNDYTGTPSLTFTANPTSVTQNSAATLSWSSTGVNSCTASVAWSGSKPLSGNESTGPLTATKTYTLTCTGAGGSISKSVTVTVAPAPDTAPPSVSITSPADGAVSGTITISATASDNVAVASVQFQLDGLVIGEDSGAPYSVSFNTRNVLNGAHTLSAVALDTSGNTARADVAVTVSNVLIIQNNTNQSLLDIPLRTWVALAPPAPFTGAKHVTAAFNPDNGRIYFTGGDHTGGRYSDSYRQETFSLSLAERWANKSDPNAGFRMEYPYCGPAGQVQPKHPDFVGWQWDSNRHVFWMIPGVMEIASSNCPGETFNRTDDPGFLYRRLMTFDPVTRLWADAGPKKYPGDDQWGGIYDPQSDTVISFAPGPRVQIYNISRGNWTTYSLYSRTSSISDWIYKGLLAADYENRIIYTIDPFRAKLYGYNIDERAAYDLGPIPGGPLTDAWQQPMIAWNPNDRVLFFHRIAADRRNFTNGDFQAYHPDTRTWEQIPLTTDIPGTVADGINIAYDPQQNIFVLLPHTSRISQKYMFLYRYSNRVGI